MSNPGAKRWLTMAVLAGAAYLAIGVAPAALAGAATSDQMREFWNVSAFVVCGIVFVAHMAHEHFQLRSNARLMAWHTATGVALGGLGLALVANIHDLGSASGYRPRMLVALVAWPLLTAAPAFVVAWALATGLRAMRIPRRELP